MILLIMLYALPLLTVKDKFIMTPEQFTYWLKGFFDYEIKNIEDGAHHESKLDIELKLETIQDKLKQVIPD